MENLVMVIKIIYFITVEKFRVNVQLCTDINEATGVVLNAKGLQDLRI